MSPIWTNILFCEELTSSFEDKLPFYQQESYVNLGAQGLDSFYYHGFWKWKSNHSLYHIDHVFQTTVHGDLLLDLIVSAKDKRSHVQAFVFGFISHYLLSRITSIRISTTKLYRRDLKNKSWKPLLIQS